MKHAVILGLVAFVCIFSSIQARSQDSDYGIILLLNEQLCFAEGEASVLVNNMPASGLKNVLINHNIVSVSKVASKWCSDKKHACPERSAIKIGSSNFYTIKMSDQLSVEKALLELNALPEVLVAERNYANYYGLTDDEDFNEQWYLHNENPVFPADIDAPQAWERTTGSNIKVCILDNGIQASHVDLPSNRITGDEGFAESQFNYPIYHGTAIAGIIGAITNNGDGIAGINWNAELYSQRVEDGKIETLYDAVLEALAYGCRLLNFSAGIESSTELLAVTAATAYKNNALMISGMGNDHDGIPGYPAAYRWCFAVGSSNMNDQPLVMDSDHGEHIDVVAPGEFLYTTIPESDYGNVGGTSFATPIVTGIASLLLSVRSDLYNDDLMNLIRISAKRYPEWDQYGGYGRVNADSALQYLCPPYTLKHCYANSSGYSSSMIKENQNGMFIDVEGLATSWYIVSTYKVSKTVNIPGDNYFDDPPFVWGRGVGTIGFSSEHHQQYGCGYCDVSEQTASTCKLTTYVHFLRDMQGEEIGWWPCSPSQVHYEYTILGKEDVETPVVTVVSPNGGEYYRTLQTIPISWEVEDDYLEGTRTTIQIKTSDNLWAPIATNLTVDSEGHGEYSYRVPAYPTAWINEHARIKIFTRDVKYREGSDVSDSDFTVEYLSKPDDEPIPRGVAGHDIPKQNFLGVPMPNPFNPVTIFKFGVKESARVSLHIYDVNGRLIKTYYNNTNVNAGEYTEIWEGKSDNGTSVVSGIYFLRYQVDDFSKTSKMILLR